MPGPCRLQDAQREEEHAALLLDAAAVAAADAKTKKLPQEGGKSFSMLLDKLVLRLQVAELGGGCHA